MAYRKKKQLLKKPKKPKFKYQSKAWSQGTPLPPVPRRKESFPVKTYRNSLYDRPCAYKLDKPFGYRGLKPWLEKERPELLRSWLETP